MSNIFARYESMDPYILLSAINLKLRDECPSLDDLCARYEVDEDKLCKRLAEKGFKYDATQNQFK